MAKLVVGVANEEGIASMDWGQIMTAIGAGAGAVLTIQKVIRGMKKAPIDRPVRDGERRSILDQLDKLEQLSLTQNREIARIDGKFDRRFDKLDARVRAMESAYARSGEQGLSNSGSTD